MILTVLATMPLNRLLGTPQQIIIDNDKLRVVGGQGDNAIVMDTTRLRKRYLVAESPEQIAYLQNSDYPYNPKQELAAAGTTQGAATQITNLIAVVTSASAGSEGVKLSKAIDGRIEFVYLVVNNTGYPIQVWPASGDFINTQEVDTALEILPGGMETFYVKFYELSEAE